eukprot:GSMAST32.ASY1.ANO1.1800.1 assembled CDS
MAIPSKNKNDKSNSKSNVSLYSLCFMSGIAVIVAILFKILPTILSSPEVSFGENSPLSVFDKAHNNALLWGTYRPGIYFGTKSRTFPESVATGVMWRSRAPGQELRHECSMSDNIDKYRWKYHDGRTFGVQDIVDSKSNLSLETSFLKSLDVPNNWAARIRGTSFSTLSSSKDASAKTVSVVNNEEEEDSVVSVHVSRRQNPNHRLHDTLKNIMEKNGGNLPNKFPKKGGINANVVIIQFTVPTNFEIVTIFTPKTLKVDGADHWMHWDSKEITNSNYSEVSKKIDEIISKRVKRFHTRFNKVFALSKKKKPQGLKDTNSSKNKKENKKERKKKKPHVFFFLKYFSNIHDTTYLQFAESALSELLGGIGYYYGQSMIKNDNSSKKEEFTPLAPLFSGSPSRPCTTGFLWDEGFHLLVIATWDATMAMDIMAHWMNQVQPSGCTLSAIISIVFFYTKFCTEQILGEEAKSRVPDQFIPQHKTHANPPTILLVLEHFLRFAPNNDENEDNTEMILFLESIWPRLDRWFSWLIQWRVCMFYFFSNSNVFSYEILYLTFFFKYFSKI